MTAKTTFAAGSIGYSLSSWGVLRTTINEEDARLAVARLLKPVPICPGCQVSLSDQERDRLYAGRSIVCRSCGRKHQLTTGTVFEGMHATYRDVVLVSAMHNNRVKIDDIALVTGLSDDTIRRLINNRLGVV